MEDPRIISALFIFLKMAYYNVLINTSRNTSVSERKITGDGTEALWILASKGAVY